MGSGAISHGLGAVGLGSDAIASTAKDLSSDLPNYVKDAFVLIYLS